MRKVFFLILIFSSLISFAQGKVSRSNNTISKEKATGTKANNKNRVPIQNSQKSDPILPKTSESVNGILVNWNRVTQNQKITIIEILNNMVYVQGGDFMMGSNDSEALNDEKPVHREHVHSFRIGRYEVTQKIWTSIMKTNPTPDFAKYIGDNLPVLGLERETCLEFINTLNGMTGLYFRLPTEAEWEYAARGGSMSKNYKYSGSNNIDDVAWTQKNSESKPQPVGTKVPNELGIYDMSGNAWEHFSDGWSENYNAPRVKSSFSIRGGAFSESEKNSRVSHRNHYMTAFSSGGMGLRLVL